MNLFWVFGGFFWLVDVIYIIWLLFFFEYDWVEWVGIVGMVLFGILVFFLVFYFGCMYVVQGGEGLFDLWDVNIDDGDFEMGIFSLWSWWLFVVVFGLVLMFLGVVVGIWIIFIGVLIVVVVIIGWYYEYYCGNFVC